MFDPGVERDLYLMYPLTEKAAAGTAAFRLGVTPNGATKSFDVSSITDNGLFVKQRCPACNGVGYERINGDLDAALALIASPRWMCCGCEMDLFRACEEWNALDDAEVLAEGDNLVGRQYRDPETGKVGEVIEANGDGVKIDWFHDPALRNWEARIGRHTSWVTWDDFEWLEVV